MQARSESPARRQHSQPSQYPEGMPPPQSPGSSKPTSSERAPSGSSKSSNRRKDPASQLSQIEKSVTHLLVATKQLLETLTQWSRNQATEGEVSDVYVRLGYEFNIACRAFTSIGVPVDDLGPVPDLLRAILEETLSQEASPQSLDRFLPKIRDIIINLLHGLKRKQSRLRAARNKDGTGTSQEPAPGSGPPIRQTSFGNYDVDESGTDRTVDSAPQRASFRPTDPRAANGRSSSDDPPSVPHRTSSVPVQVPFNGREDQQSSMQEPRRRISLRERPASPPVELDASNIGKNLPIVQTEDSSGPIQRISLHGETPPPPPPPKQQDALAALQRGGELERRASRRYSAYQISKHLGASPGGVPMLPPAQHSPIPNRGRDVRESLNAVRTRSSLVPGQSKSQVFKDTSPGRSPAAPKGYGEGENSNARPASMTTEDQPTSLPPDGKSPLALSSTHDDRLAMSGTISGPLADTFQEDTSAGIVSASSVELKPPQASAAKTPRQPSVEIGQPQFVPEISPQPGRELTLFLQYKSRIKKIVMPDGANDLSMARLQLAFIEKFAWNTHNNGVDLPEIYIQDTVSGVRHELEDLSDIKDRSVLVLNVEPLDEIKRHFDENFGTMRKLVEGVSITLGNQQATISQVSNRQQDSAKEIARLAAAPSAPRSHSLQLNGGLRSPLATDSALREVQTLRRDLAIMRQTVTSFSTGVHTSMAAIRRKAENVKARAVDAAIPVFDEDTGRAYVNNGKKSLSDDSDTLVNRVDDLQDLVEDLRKDVVSRGVRPLPRQLEAANKDVTGAKKELKKMQEYVKREKPIWTKIWEKELELVCNDREFLTMQEELIADLEDDLDKAMQTMNLVEQATRQQNVQASAPGGATTLRPAARNVPTIDTTDVDPHKAKDGVLGQVRALKPNHESRLEAIERAEKARQRELESRHRDAAFKKELGEFVEEGRLKKSGGFEEAERARRTKDELAMKDEFDEQQKRKAERAKARAEERARLAAAAQSSSKGGNTEETEAEGEDSADEEMKDAQDGLEAEVTESSGESTNVASPSGRRSWLPSFMSGGSN